WHINPSLIALFKGSPNSFFAMKTSLIRVLPVLLVAAVAWAQPAPQDNWTFDFSIPGPNTDGAFKGPLGIAAGPNGKILVADSGNDRIQIFDATNTLVLKFGRNGTTNGLFSICSGLAVAPDGRIVVCDRNNSRLQVFNPDGSFSHTIGSLGLGAGQLRA